MVMNNAMRKIRIEKIVLNIGAGDGDVESAEKVLRKVVETAGIKQKPKITFSKKRSTFKVPKGKPIGCKITIRTKTDEFLKRLLNAIEGKITEKNFDDSGNFSFGVPEYITIPDIEYDPSIPILGFDVCVRLERPGYRVARKRLGSKVGKKHRITKEEAIAFVKENFGVDMNEKKEG